MSLIMMLGLLAYQGNQSVAEERMKVQYVLLDVVVTDRRGNVITDLKPEDFVVTENKRPVKVTFFDQLDYTNELVGDSGVADDTLTVDKQGTVIDEKPLQQIILALDFESVVLREVNKAFVQLNQFLDTLDGRYRYAINLYALDRGSLTSGFTSDLDSVKAALAKYQDRFAKNRFRGSTFDRDLPLFGGEPNRSRARASGGRGPGGGMQTLTDDVNDLSSFEQALMECARMGNSNGQACACLYETTSQFLEEQKYRTERVIGELEILTEKFNDGSDLKTMMLLSPGFALRNIPAIEDLRDDIGRNLGCTEQRIGGSLLGGRLFIDADFKKVTHACIKNRVIFHTFDIFNTNKSQRRSLSAEYRGGASNAVSSAYWNYGKQITQGLKELARESGGQFKQVFRLDGAMNKTLQSNRFFYVLGYDSPAGKSGAFREIKVKVKRKRVKVRHRRGYFGR